eukprot:TRINITY_DN704_c0_g1_i1.p1 TRINITY_DN704_c0_g1~~TRINITY_DN704_c0_g1_i1.p1  ORF type:complete len:174 (-),score=20.78 TRINITY_DN704_c0_g1_i1:239-760(-)
MQKFSDHKKQERFDIELEFFGIDLTPQMRKLFEGDREFVYEAPMDNKGLFYYLGTLNRDTWASPVGAVKVEASTQGGSNLVSIFDRVGESSVENLYSSSGSQWLSVTLEKGVFCPTGYWMKQESAASPNSFNYVEISFSNDFQDVLVFLTGSYFCRLQMIDISEIGNFKELHQ